ncbi:MAG: uridine phosphorylase [Clostridiales bacterium]|nr:uridine phosphorylase [Clostridiales bacterium]
MHVQLKRGEVGEYCILPGDPGRCELIAKRFENPVKMAQNREFITYTGTLLGKPVTVCSTGIGGPSAAIAVEELCSLGAHTFIRVGTCGGISLDVQGGDIVIVTAAVRQDGTSREYAPIEFPATANFEVTTALKNAAKTMNIKSHLGIVQSKDSFYGQHSPERMPTSFELTQKWEAWKRLGVLASEMETSTVFTVSSALRARAGAVLLALWNQEREKAALKNVEASETEIAIDIAIEAIKELMQKD